MSDDEKKLWDGLRATVKPLKRKSRHYEIPDVVRPEPDDAPAREVTSPMVEPEGVKKTLSGEQVFLKEGDFSNINGKQAKQLKKGDIRPDSTLDLHGLTRDAAHERVDAFVREAAASGKRCVLIITGKGTRSAPEADTLKSSLPGWLNSPALRSLVLAYTQAATKDGGAGAFYILLKK